MIIVSPLHELETALARWRPSHVVSLASPGAEAATLPHDVEVLWLGFHDIVASRPGLTMATGEQAAALIAFAERWRPERPMLVHCWAGVSRSPAAAYVIACVRTAAGEENAIAQALRDAAPFATPNLHMVALADDLLGRGGRMVAAIQSLGRGAETSLGRMFRLDHAEGGPVL